MSNITVTVAEFPSTSQSAKVYTGAAGASVSAILANVGISADNRTMKFNSVEVSASTTLSQDGLLTVTRSAKGNS